MNTEPFRGKVQVYVYSRDKDTTKSKIHCTVQVVLLVLTVVGPVSHGSPTQTAPENKLTDPRSAGLATNPNSSKYTRCPGASVDFDHTLSQLDCDG